MADDISLDIVHDFRATLPDDPESEISSTEWNAPHKIAPGSITRAMLEPSIGIFWKGPWVISAAYAKGDIVSSEGSSFVCITANSGQPPPNVAYWENLAARGATWWSGAGEPTVVVGASPGDYYLDTVTGLIYKLV